MIYFKKLFTALFTFILFLAFIQKSDAQVMNPVKWNFSVKKISKDDSELVLTATIDKGWHLYSQNIPEGGPIATTFKFDKGTGFFLIGKIIEPKSTEVFDKVFNMKINYFSGKVEFRQKVKIMSAKPVEIKGIVEFMCCNDETCIPPAEVDFSFTLPASK